MGTEQIRLPLTAYAAGKLKDQIGFLNGRQSIIALFDPFLQKAVTAVNCKRGCGIAAGRIRAPFHCCPKKIRDLGKREKSLGKMRIDVIAQKQARQLPVFFEICKHQGHALLYALPVIGVGLMLFVVLEFSHIALQTYIPQLKATIAEKTKNADTAELEQLLLRPEATNTEVPQAQP